MIAALKKYESVIHAGLLSKAALYLKGDLSYDNNDTTDKELAVIQAIIDEVATSLGIDPRDEDSIDRIVNYLDNEIDALVPDTVNQTILEKLSERGELPSDLYKINIIPSIKDFYKDRYAKEYDKIKETITSPDREQHYGPPSNKKEPFLISLFSRFYNADYSYDSYYLLVVGQRSGLRLDVHQVWRIYQDLVPSDRDTTLLELLKAFAEKYGFDIESNGKRSKFFVSETAPRESTFNIKVPSQFDKHGKPLPTSFTFSHFIQNNPISEEQHASLLIAINLTKYKEMLNERKW